MQSAWSVFVVFFFLFAVFFWHWTTLRDSTCRSERRTWFRPFNAKPQIFLFQLIGLEVKIYQNLEFCQKNLVKGQKNCHNFGFEGQTLIFCQNFSVFMVKLSKLWLNKVKICPNIGFKVEISQNLEFCQKNVS